MAVPSGYEFTGEIVSDRPFLDPKPTSECKPRMTAQAKTDIDRSAPISRIWPRTKIRSLSTPQPGRSRQLFEQRLRILRIGGVEALGEPDVDGGEEVAGVGGLALGIPEPGKAGRGAESGRGKWFGPADFRTPARCIGVDRMATIRRRGLMRSFTRQPNPDHLDDPPRPRPRGTRLGGREA